MSSSNILFCVNYMRTFAHCLEVKTAVSVCVIIKLQDFGILKKRKHE